jgi:nucleoside 2-deoxyribosyltransferase
MKNYTYLAGPMEDISEEEMTGWRDTATYLLDLSGIESLDPTRRVSFHDQLKGGDASLQEEIRNMNISKRIFKQDLQDINDSRVILADVRRSAGRGTGTSCELMFAHTKNKIIILWADKDDYPHPFIDSMYTEKHYDLNEAIHAATTYY